MGNQNNSAECSPKIDLYRPLQDLENESQRLIKLRNTSVIERGRHTSRKASSKIPLNSDFLFLFERLGDVDLDSDFDIICNFMDSSISSTSTSLSPYGTRQNKKVDDSLHFKARKSQRTGNQNNSAECSPKIDLYRGDNFYFLWTGSFSSILLQIHFLFTRHPIS
jgi:hypothetical protein